MRIWNVSGGGTNVVFSFEFNTSPENTWELKSLVGSDEEVEMEMGSSSGWERGDAGRFSSCEVGEILGKEFKSDESSSMERGSE